MARLRRIVCYAVNGSGLGHVTRLLAITRWLRRYGSVLEGRVPEVVFLTSAEATSLFLKAGVASFKVPSKTVVRAAGMNVQEYRRLAKQFVWQTLGVFQPDLLVVDTFPSGSFDELLQVLDGPFAAACVLRKVKPEFAERAVFAAALGLYDTVVVPHAEGEDVAVPDSARDVRFCGPVMGCERAELPDRETARDELGVAPDQTLIYVSAGGGGDPESERTLARIIGVLADRPETTLLVGAGPLYRGRRHGHRDVIWFDGPGVVRFLGACDAAVSAGGYNTFHELLYLGVPTVFYAQPKVADDQWLRVSQAAATGACLTWDRSDDPTLSDAVEQLLLPEGRAARARASAELVPENAARAAARAALRPLYDDDALAWAGRVVDGALAHAFERHGPEGGEAMARWLPALLPRDSLDALSGRPDFEALVQRLSPEAAGEVRQALTDSDDTDALDALNARLTGLVDQAHGLPGGLSDLTALVDAALKKHPLQQEGHRDRVAWIANVLGLVGRVMDHHRNGFAPADRMRLYRVFPRLVDVTSAEAFDTFEAVVTRAASDGVPAHVLLDRIRGLKFAQRRVERAGAEHALLTAPVEDPH